MSYLSDLLGETYKEGMTEDEISAALEVADKKRISNLLTKANSDAASYKKKMKEAQESASAATSETEKMSQRIAELERLQKISENKAKFLAMGYDETLAADTATAYADGDMDKIMENQKTFLITSRKTLEADILKSTPKPKTGSTKDTGKPSIAADLEKKYYQDKYGFTAKTETKGESET